MSRTLQITCDSCGVLKGETNHWYQAVITQHESNHVMSLYSGTGFTADASKKVADFCGEACVLKFVAGQIQERKA